MIESEITTYLLAFGVGTVALFAVVFGIVRAKGYKNFEQDIPTYYSRQFLTSGTWLVFCFFALIALWAMRILILPYNLLLILPVLRALWIVAAAALSLPKLDIPTNEP